MNYTNKESLKENIKSLVGMFTDEGFMIDLQAALNAIDFASTDDVVEVIRCIDCKHSRPIDKTRSPEKYFKDECIVCECEDVVGDEPMIYYGSHFCGYGENK